MLETLDLLADQKATALSNSMFVVTQEQFNDPVNQQFLKKHAVNNNQQLQRCPNFGQIQDKSRVRNRTNFEQAQEKDVDEQDVEKKDNDDNDDNHNTRPTRTLRSIEDFIDYNSPSQISLHGLQTSIHTLPTVTSSINIYDKATDLQQQLERHRYYQQLQRDSHKHNRKSKEQRFVQKNNNNNQNQNENQTKGIDDKLMSALELFDDAEQQFNANNDDDDDNDLSLDDLNLDNDIRTLGNQDEDNNNNNNNDNDTVNVNEITDNNNNTTTQPPIESIEAPIESTEQKDNDGNEANDADGQRLINPAERQTKKMRYTTKDDVSRGLGDCGYIWENSEHLKNYPITFVVDQAQVDNFTIC